MGIEKQNDLKLWAFFFLYTFCVSAFVQIILLPYVFPSLHAGRGLLVSSFDSIGNDWNAAQLVNKIRSQGWSIWELKPRHQFPVGLAAIFYYFIFPDPRILIPISSVLHASAALILVKLLDLFLKNRKRSIICALPFLIFPSNLQWTAQWHKDGFSILGLFLIIYSMISVTRALNCNVRNLIGIIPDFIISFSSGILLIWLAREYILKIIIPFIVLVLLFLVFVRLTRLLKSNGLFRNQTTLMLTIFLILSVFSAGIYKYYSKAKRNASGISSKFRNQTTLMLSIFLILSVFSAMLSIFLMLSFFSAGIHKYYSKAKRSASGISSKFRNQTTLMLIIFFILSVFSAGIYKYYSNAERFPDSIGSKKNVIFIDSVGKEHAVAGTKDVISIWPATEDLTKKNANIPTGQASGVRDLKKNYIIKLPWKRSWYLPLVFDKQFNFLAKVRDGFRTTPGMTNIDGDVIFTNAKDILLYLPRAFQIAFFSPFPNNWFSEGSSPANTIMRIISAFEMPLIYFSLIFLPCALWHWRKRAEIWVIFTFCAYMMIISGLVFCNIGTLYRMRYPYIMILVALGMGGFFIFMDIGSSKKTG